MRYLLTLLLLAIGLRAAPTITSVSQVSDNGFSVANFTFTYSLSFSAGDFGVLSFGSENAGSGGSVPCFPSSFTDAVGNTWTRRVSSINDPSTVGVGVEIAIYTCQIRFAISSASTSATLYWDGGVTVQYKMATLFKIVPGSGWGVQYASGAGAGTTGEVTAPTQTTPMVPVDYFVIGLGISKGGTTWVNPSGWTEDSNTATSGDELAIISSHKTVATKAAQTWNPTLDLAYAEIGYVIIAAYSTANTGAASLFFTP